MLLPPEKTINTVMQSNSGVLHDLVVKSSQLKQLNDSLHRYISADLVEQCKVVEFEQGCLIIAASNGNYATLLRYQVSELLSALRKEPNFYGLASIKIQVAAILKPIEKKASSPVERLLPPEASACLLSTAADIDNEALKEALVQLASHRRSLDEA